MPGYRWLGNNWEYLAGGAMVAAGVGLMFTGHGGPAGLALVGASGALISAGANTLIQKGTTGTVDWKQVGTEDAVGGATGILGGAAGTALMITDDLVTSARAAGLLDNAPASPALYKLPGAVNGRNGQF
jgi:hypothetical protein